MFLKCVLEFPEKKGEATKEMTLLDITKLERLGFAKDGKIYAVYPDGEQYIIVSPKEDVLLQLRHFNLIMPKQETKKENE